MKRLSISIIAVLLFFSCGNQPAERKSVNESELTEILAEFSQARMDSNLRGNNYSNNELLQVVLEQRGLSRSVFLSSLSQKRPEVYQTLFAETKPQE